ncbi:unnamed protein product [Oppiella nova]|uniref:Protein-tyrosine-phosphatase n=1 Tax=Oppiella nova TaxID=334625 RepID=A0A7R9QCN6_9ACAR|nr:unnamed protein product [Oppiella nova]CAG2163257.1 unnamed protein product [Oppiella nova]
MCLWSGCFGDCCGLLSSGEYPLEKNCLQKGQTSKKTAFGRSINSRIQTMFMTAEEQKVLKLQIVGQMGTVFDRPFNHFTQITDTLYLTSYGGITADNMSKHDMKCMISATHETPVYQVEGIEFIRIPIEDSHKENIIKYFDEICVKVSELMAKNVRTVIHCWAGKCRSATIMIAILMKSQNMPLTEAYKTVWTKRPFIHINKGFLYQLYIYEKDVFGKNWTHFKTIKAQNNVQISSMKRMCSARIGQILRQLKPKIMFKSRRKRSSRYARNPDSAHNRLIRVRANYGESTCSSSIPMSYLTHRLQYRCSTSWALELQFRITFRGPLYIPLTPT